MTHTYVAYIDESGDDGLGKYREPGGRGGASPWLVISACIFRATHQLDAVTWRDEISSRMPEKKSRTLHFKDLSHGQKVVAAQVIGNKPLRTVSILAAKRPIPDGIYTQKNQLYFYLTRYLIERISWLCRDMRPRAPEGDGRVKITFSRRGGMSYEDFRAYLTRLQGASSDDVRIHWPVIDISAVDAQDHSKLASLQIADAVASSFAAAVEPDIYGNCETRYSELLRGVTYNHKGKFLSYGLKSVPTLDRCLLSAEQQKIFDMFG
ncbi:DUF3800 domain-containing protein [Gemmobacter sp. LW-1]|uniref:DUF3800 domain-containing protein n=1 Tax=Gemmobacter sp. LW-1 TaxID=1529005 RepID=UPI0006C75249|nr:DUF3800 domain-containing protein [Gemmobacter sp. LW-1]